MNRVGFGSIDSIPTWFGNSVSILLRSSGPNTHAGPSLLFRKRFAFDRFDNISRSICPPPLLVIEPQPGFVASGAIWSLGPDSLSCAPVARPGLLKVPANKRKVPVGKLSGQIAPGLRGVIISRPGQWGPKEEGSSNRYN